MFSYFYPENTDCHDYRDAILENLGKMLDEAEKRGINLCHENEKGIYGDVAIRCKELLDTFPQLKNIFDPANFIQSGQDTLEAWQMLRDRTLYLHIKDALADGRVVPAGKGIGNLPCILKDFIALGGRQVTIEPHLTVFSGLKDLERAGEETKMVYTYSSGDEAFDAACNALKACL